MKIYIASPYTKGDQAENVRRQLEVADKLMSMGHTPFLPLLSHFQHLCFPRPYEDWMRVDLEWLYCCDALLRLDGESEGADREVEEAEAASMDIYYSLEQIPCDKVHRAED